MTDAFLRRWPLPRPGEGGDKEARGRVLVVGGGREMPGAVILAATAALRAGAGKLQIAVGKSVAPVVAQAVPEALVAGLPETPSGGLAGRGAARLARLAEGAGAILLGPGMEEEPGTAALLRALVGAAEKKTVVVLDAGALAPLRGKGARPLASLEGRAVLTPHAGEMAMLLGRQKGAIARDPGGAARRAAKEFGAVIVMKGEDTVIAGRRGGLYRNRAGNVGLAISGSGDTLSGIVSGLAARGAPPDQAAVWAVALHARAGDRLARTIGPLGFLPRELLAEIPRLMAGLGGRREGK
ncbi:MAG: NAD(P)H-hydrate dehydratase [Acidobacteria bacterium]|nr:NAD(P)H-hydrate dehydratase [Acidobacteriota bacterium]